MNREIIGVTTEDHDFKLNMCVDDILLTLSNPSQTTPKVLETVKKFGNLSGYKLNWTKTEAIPLNQCTRY